MLPSGGLLQPGVGEADARRTCRAPTARRARTPRAGTAAGRRPTGWRRARRARRGPAASASAMRVRRSTALITRHVVGLEVVDELLEVLELVGAVDLDDQQLALEDPVVGDDRPRPGSGRAVGELREQRRPGSARRSGPRRWRRRRRRGPARSGPVGGAAAPASSRAAMSSSAFSCGLRGLPRRAGRRAAATSDQHAEDDATRRCRSTLRSPLRLGLDSHGAHDAVTSCGSGCFQDGLRSL